jgi:uncharacterized membrane protein YraQ (UPF0718 family)
MNMAWQQFTAAIWQIVSESAFWVVLSLVVGGLVHEFLPTSRFRELLNRKGHASILGAIAFGAVLPICSCGVIPLAISLYRSGVRLGPVMAFAAATPIINPAAVILSLALLGPQITLAYVTLGLVLPFMLGVIAERWGTRSGENTEQETSSCCSSSPCGDTAGSPALQNSTPVRIGSGLRWGIMELGPTIAFYMAIGVLLAGLIAAFLPPSWVDSYLRDSSGVALLAAGVLGASIYVCAVAHIPMVASLLATGAAPGISIVFLVTGTATNLPELIALYNTIGKRTVILYACSLIIGAMIAGAVINAWLMPGFEPVFDPIRSLDMIDVGESLQPTVGNVLTLSSTAAIVILAGVGTWRKITARFSKRNTGSGDSCCSG